jgi:hypothetical protein
VTLKGWKKGDAVRIIIRLKLACTLAALLVFPVHAGALGGALVGVLNNTYLIENQAVPIVNGRAEFQAAPGSAIKITIEVFGKPAFGDLNHDGRDDAALFLVHDPGGSGTFYYVAAAIATSDSYLGTNAVLLGDRVFPRTIHIRNGVIVAKFDDPNLDQSMAAAPSIGKTKYLKLKEGHLEVNKAP